METHIHFMAGTCPVCGGARGAFFHTESLLYLTWSCHFNLVESYPHPRTSPITLCVLIHFSHVQLRAILWTVARQAPLPWDSPGKNIEVGCHALLQGIFPTQGLNPCFLMSPALAGIFFTTSSPGKPINHTIRLLQIKYYSLTEKV